MRINVSFIILLLISMLFAAGCGGKDNVTPADASGKEEPEVEAEDEEDEEEEMDEEEEPEEPEEEPAEAADEDEEEESDAAQPLGDRNVYLGGELVETEDKIIIHGESNLLPGARVVGTVTIGDLDEDGAFFADTSELIEDDGSFYMEIDHERTDQPTTVAVSFNFDVPQEDSIIRYYGERGSKLEGPYIYKHQRAAGGRSPQDIYNMAMVTATFQSDEEMAVRQFEEPDWYPIPEDFGDPRVWLEVEEITNDEDYFYVHGRSNLIEGSKIEGSYEFERVETLIKPDGSFDFKLPYEYREDTPIVIKFDPNNLQWNIVEEVYGKEGQKLVGDLVETNEYNQRQYIEKEIPLESSELIVPDNVELTIEGSEVTMVLPDHILFDFDKYELKKESKQTLKEIAQMLEQFDDMEIIINGHTDNVGNPGYNMELSEKRAEEVKKFLMKQADLKDGNLETNGYGETKPIASNDDEAGQAKNRRVEIIMNLKK